MEEINMEDVRMYGYERNSAPGSPQITEITGDDEWQKYEATTSQALCDGCDNQILGLRHKCQDCPDFDYCDKCAVDASTTHPYHSFTTLRIQPADDLDLGRKGNDESVENNLVTNGNAGHGDEAELPQCELCSQISMILPTLHLVERPPGKENATGVFRWQIRLSKLVATTQRGCAFCSLVLDKIFTDHDISYFGFQPSKTWHTNPSKDEKERARLVQACMEKLTLMKSDDFILDIEPIYDPAPPHMRRLAIGLSRSSFEYHDKDEIKQVFRKPGLIKFEVDVFTTPGNSATEHILTRPPNPFPGSEESFVNVKKWMLECENSHACCKGISKPKRLPGRVIDVSSSANVDEVKLYTPTSREEGRYTALSYCWGGPQDDRTTRENVGRRQTGFRITDLPQTLQDAVRVTRSLGISYLWVDSICIIQDDKEDQAINIGEMGNIYQNANLTICASRTDKAEEGFLNDWSNSETGLWPSLVPFAYSLPNDEAKTFDEAMELPRKDVGTIWLMNEDEACSRLWSDFTSRRAWCLQERVLSPRMLDYNRWPSWRCNAGVQTDGGFHLQDERSGPEERRLTKALNDRRSGKLDMFTNFQLYKAWYKLLNEFTKRKVTVESDRLPAFGGIAAQMSRLLGAKYYAGLWENNLLHDMMWDCAPGEWLIRPEAWRAPSWSWASVQSPVSYDSISEDATPTATVESCSVTPRFGQTHLFGEISSGRLEITGPFAKLDREDVLKLLRSQNLAPPPPDSNYGPDWTRIMMMHLANRPSSDASKKIESTLPENIFGLITFSKEWTGEGNRLVSRPCYSGLLLRESEDGCYERIGSFFEEASDWVSQEKVNWPSRTIVLI